MKAKANARKIPVKYYNETIMLCLCHCGAIPRINGGSCQSPFEQSFEIICDSCGAHTFRLGFANVDKIRQAAIEAWNNGEWYPKGSTFSQEEYDRLFRMDL